MLGIAKRKVVYRAFMIKPEWKEWFRRLIEKGFDKNHNGIIEKCLALAVMKPVDKELFEETAGRYGTKMGIYSEAQMFVTTPGIEGLVGKAIESSGFKNMSHVLRYAVAYCYKYYKDRW